MLLGFFALVLWDFNRLDASSHSASDTLRPFLIHVVLLTLLLLIICWRTGEELRWQWGCKTGEKKPDEESI